MVKDNHVYSALLTQAAKAALRPLGMFQKGRSRTWLSDQVWWLVVVEFQASGFSRRGSYLNVGCMWLWHVQEHISFNLGYCVEGFQKFESEAQFETVANRLANVAAEHVLRYRKQFSTIWSLSDYSIKHPPMAGWPSFDAGIAHALSGHSTQGAHLLHTAFSQDRREIGWVQEAKRDAAMLLEILPDHDRFRALITDRVRETRRLLKLPEKSPVELS